MIGANVSGTDIYNILEADSGAENLSLKTGSSATVFCVAGMNS